MLIYGKLASWGVSQEVCNLIKSDKCVYYKFENSICVIICLYVDELLIFGSSIQVVNDVKVLLCNKFDMKDLREAKMILEIMITRSKKGINLDQSHYVCTPYNSSVKLFKNTSDNANRLSMRALLTVIGMPLIVLDQILDML